MRQLCVMRCEALWRSSDEMQRSSMMQLHCSRECSLVLRVGRLFVTPLV